MDYYSLMNIHLATVVPAFVIGTVLLTIKKGTLFHKIAGRVYMVLMLFTSFVALFMPAFIGPKLFNHFGFIHLFCLLTIYTVPTAYTAIKRGDVNVHKRKMVLLYFGALVIAGSLTFLPGRYLHQMFFGV